jgi:glycosyltransferase involved in cell wall biosynthesis
MWTDLGYEIYVYGAEGDEVDDRCTEHITVITKAEQEYNFGSFEKNKLYELDWTGQKPYWRLFNNRTEKELMKRKQPKDFLCLIASHLNDQVVKAAGGDVIPLEWGIGYDGPHYPFRVYESYSHLHRIHGHQKFNDNGSFYECVIPNYWDDTKFPLCTEKDDYYLYLGRIIQRKGVTIASQTCDAIGAKLIIAGQGVKSVKGDRIECVDGGIYKGEYVGCVIGEEKIKLLQRAWATFVPSLYVEPFGGVAAESQLVGTPAITTDFGAFTETVEHGKTGYRCHTLNEFVHAAKNVHTLDPQYIRNRAVSLWSMDVIKFQYDVYFKRLYDLWGTGWPMLHPEVDVNWLKKA